MKTIAIYHKNCTDGTAAAAVVLRKYPGALLFPISHGYAPEEFEPVLGAVERGDRVLTVDCVMGVRELLAAGHKVTSIDHHIGKRDEYAKLSAENTDFTFVFDNDKSGASLAWSYLFPDEPMPELIKYIEDNDLWRWKYGEDTQAIGSVLFMLQNEPEKMLAALTKPIEPIKAEGRIIRRYASYIVDWSVREIESVNVMVGGHKVPFYNSTSYKSELGNRFAIERGQAVGIFSMSNDEVKISFRSLDGQTPSALELAQALGGGGHVRASGAAMSLDDFCRAIAR